MTRVYFRKFTGGNAAGDIIAIFPDWRGSDVKQGGDYDTVQSYEHIGQHGAASEYLILQRTVAATPAEYADLAKELKGQGYKKLTVVRPNQKTLRYARVMGSSSRMTGQSDITSKVHL